jgi:predicted transcriptional regulator
VYRAISRKELREKLESCVENWYKRMQSALEQFGSADVD